MDDIGFGAFFWFQRDEDPGEFAARIEELGFDGFWTGEVPNNRGPSLDQFTAMCMAAASTTRITIGSDVTLTPLHHPAWLAKQLASLDVVSRGRVIAGLGVGGEYAKQFELFGVPVNERGARTDESIEVMRALWTEDSASYDGRHFRFSGISMEPKPRQTPHPPLWIGGRLGGTEAGPDGTPKRKSRVGAARRAARYGDGWCPLYMTPEMYADSIQLITSYAREQGRDISDMTWALTTFWLLRDSYDEALDAARSKLRYGRDLSDRVARYDILGNPRDAIRRLEQFVEAGVRYFVCNWSCEPEEIPAHLEWIARDVIPHFR